MSLRTPPAFIATIKVLQIGSCKIETPPAKVGGVFSILLPACSYEVEVPPAKAGGVFSILLPARSYEVEVPPAKAGGVFSILLPACSYEVEVPPAKAGGVCLSLSRDLVVKLRWTTTLGLNTKVSHATNRHSLLP
jgi:hypothetical protein